MALPRAICTFLEKTALDNGFSLLQQSSGEWLIWKAHAVPVRICMTAMTTGYAIGSDKKDIMDSLGREVVALPGTPMGFSVLHVSSPSDLHDLAGAIWRRARSLPDEPLRLYHERLSETPDATEVERMRKERIGQDVFREALMLYWDRRCAVTGISEELLLRASHIVPWAECETDAERLNVRNGLLLAAHLDAAFDAYLVSFDTKGRVLFSPRLKEIDIAMLGLHTGMGLRRTEPGTERRLKKHRVRLLG